MIIVEASANDIGTIERNVQALIRHVRRNFPHLGMLWLEMATRNSVGQRKKLKTGSIRLPPYRLDAAHDHLEVLSYYDLPQLDILRMIGPGWSEADWNFREGCYFSDPIHPTRYGHNISASVLMFAIEGMLQRAEAQDPMTSVQGNQFNSSALPPPMVMDTLMAEFFESKFVESIEFNKEETFSRHVKANENWYFGTDLAKKPKTIMTTSHNSCITIDLKYSGRISILLVSLFHSYEGVGIARVGLSEKCTVTSNKFAPVGKEEVYDCLWSEHASVARLHILPQDFSLLGHSGCAKYLRVCSNENPDRGAKLKLFSTSFSRKT
ncbi:Hypothetical Protein FCC1311_108802 [Hondaea fermentalgiana]|uniref:SGNH hydrolase-type esterase domain-containing protein n=1 Tax=Hondaea fermentalgiana TaxID=2315210 RepID=A0A2R5GXY4_9STRA|nr:Hypothetical Protein FCC1311_108802 [Hondaea fermentalgiana]|eukprot:GBG34658.1 Hypothetical Protein FCC1311_108802 [Hondaea fermentalgiana]